MSVALNRVFAAIVLLAATAITLYLADVLSGVPRVAAEIWPNLTGFLD